MLLVSQSKYWQKGAKKNKTNTSNNNNEPNYLKLQLYTQNTHSKKITNVCCCAPVSYA